MGWTTRTRVWMGPIAIAIISIYCTATYGEVSPEWAAKWEEDLRFAQTESVEKHPDLFHRVSEAEWDAAFEALIVRLPSLEHYEIAVELAAIVAMVQDGHTRLTLPLAPGVEFMQGHTKTPTPFVDALLFHQFPVRFFIDENGVYVRRIDARHAAVLGGRVVGIGALTTEEAVAAVAPTIRRDNEAQLRHHLPMHLVLAEVLAARGVIADLAQLSLRVELRDGSTREIDLNVVQDGKSIEWVDARPDQPLPLYLRHPNKNFWFANVEDAPILYLQFNEVYDSESESIAAFADRLGESIAGDRIEALIVDLRQNRGGDMGLSRPLLHAILCSSVNRAGRLYVVAGRTTFSAAMSFALDLEHHTDALFVGEPTGSTPNHYGDSRKILLPNTGLTLRVSTRYHQHDFTDNRLWIEPHLPAEITMDDYVTGNDPAVNIVRTIVTDEPGDEALAGAWSGRASIGLNTLGFLLAIDAEEGGRLEVRDIGFEATLENLRTQGRRVGFHVQSQRGVVQFDAAFSAKWMTGTLGEASRRYPFVLRRQ